MSSKAGERRRERSEGLLGLSGQQASRLKKRAAAEAGFEDDLVRLVRIIARQAAQEALAVFKDDLYARGIGDQPLPDRSTPDPARESSAGKGRGLTESGERFLSIAEVAKRLDVSEKTVRRKVASGDLPAHRVGKLLRVSEGNLRAYVTRPRSLLD
jgi:excisionase family DNA binding protein